MNVTYPFIAWSMLFKVRCREKSHCRLGQSTFVSRMTENTMPWPL